MEPQLVKSAERTVRILEALAAAPGTLTLSEVQQLTGFPRSSLHALMRTLVELNWVETDAARSAFGIGPHALLTGTAYLDKDPALPFAQATLEDLREETGQTAHFARRDEAHVLYLATRESRDAHHIIPRVGRRLPAHVTALGQVLLAQLTDDEVKALLPDPLPGITDHTITDLGKLTGELDQVRTRGWAYEREQGTSGVACVAVTVDYRIPATDAISCSMPADLPPAQIERVIEAVITHTHKLAATLRREGIR
ncbi:MULTISPECIES: IclR family transcriptional regulator [Nonomuraea]|uniref:IclR family transcriptional regulator n=1 Tax=Nonomuraea ferruginea TaxID=46174 RepID=A0ABT4T480_9ACTN|nr:MULTISPECIES: IclR family transcriptional regulator [Nonomuraea]MDA0644307.1 IclR family transcriptional regulator [Nonomuraea ferruginea]TXK42778.1 IclR family transcriptional regulator [Nonomuraea sp. C10]